MDLSLMAVALGLLLIGLLWWRVRRNKGGSTNDRSSDRVDTVSGWPPKATRILTTAERMAHDTLMRALPEYMILAQVPLARFLKVPTRNSYVEWLRRLGNQCADLVVCDKNSQVIAVVDIQASAEKSSERARKRLHRMARVLRSAEIPLHVWTEGALPGVDAARETILPRPVAPSAAAHDTAGDSVGAAVTRPSVTRPSPLDEPQRDEDEDEVIEAREPPPSTWFDEFNSGPAPLGQPRKRK